MNIRADHAAPNLICAVENFVKHLEPFDMTLVEYTSYADTHQQYLVTTCCIENLVSSFNNYNKEVVVSIPASVFEDCCLAVE